jgi:glycosyltransferase involved in cell wall biosynthesis
MHLVPNGVSWTGTDEEKRRLAQSFRDTHIGEADDLLGVVARVEVEKRPDLLVDALALLPMRVQDRLRVVWVGAENDPDLGSRVSQRATASGLDGVLAFLPPTRDIASVYPALDALVLCSDWEGFPNAVLEALAYGVPVVSTDVGDVGRLLRGEAVVADVAAEGRKRAEAVRAATDAAHGWLVPPGDAPALAEAIAACVEAGAEARREKGSLGSRHVLEHYSADALAARTMEVYARVLGRGRSS